MYLLGSGGHAKVIVDIFELQGKIIEGIFEKDMRLKKFNSYKVLPESDIKTDYELFIAVGNNDIRKNLALKYGSNEYVNAIHPSAIISTSVKLGSGVAVMANATISVETDVGDHVIVNTSSSIDHDCSIGDFVHIGPNSTLSGGIYIGEKTMLGAGVTVIPNIEIGRSVIIGAGSVILESVPDNVLVVGNPGKVIKSNL